MLSIIYTFVKVIIVKKQHVIIVVVYICPRLLFRKVGGPNIAGIVCIHVHV